MNRLPACLALALLFCTFVMAGDAEKETPMTMSRALKLGLDGLLSASDPSEAGQDHAARLYAAAKRVETENVLAKKNVELVLALDDWRYALAGCRRGSCELAYIVNGGGTMYSHGEARDCAPVEDFLADLAKQLPLAAGKGSARANEKIDDAIAFLKTLKIYDADNDKEASTNLAAERDRVIEKWQTLKYLIDEIPAKQAGKITACAEESLSWLKEQ
jgi:hypothetical protein